MDRMKVGKYQSSGHFSCEKMKKHTKKFDKKNAKFFLKLAVNALSCLTDFETGIIPAIKIVFFCDEQSRMLVSLYPVYFPKISGTRIFERI